MNNALSRSALKWIRWTLFNRHTSLGMFIWNAWDYRLTTPGKFILGGIFITGIFGSASLSQPIYHLFIPLVCIYIFTFLFSVLWKPRVKIIDRIPSKVTAGETLRGEIEVTNLARRPIYNLSFALRGLPPSLKQIDQDAMISQLSAGESMLFPVKIHARKRGLYPLSKLQSYTTFPFNLFRRNGPFQRVGSLMVLPRFRALADFQILIGRRYQPGGIALTSNIAEAPEYIGNREYRPGDSIRRIDFRSWARLAKPVVREYQEEYYCRLAFVLDTFVGRKRAKKKEGIPELEASISLVASIADALANGEYIIDLFAAGPELHKFRGGRSLNPIENILEILACIEDCQHSPFENLSSTLSDQLSKITGIVIVLMDWDMEREKFVKSVVEAGTTAKVLIVRNEKTSISFAPAEDWAGQIIQLSPQHILDGKVRSL